MYSIGIDSGSTTTKGVLFDGNIVKTIILKTSVKPRESILAVYENLTAQLKEKPYLVVTGYGRSWQSLQIKKSLKLPAMVRSKVPL